ncbi:energy transducer TonB [Massilia sp. SR12]
MNRIHTHLFLAAAASLAMCGQAKASEAVQRPKVDFHSCSQPPWPAADLEAKHTGTVALRLNVSENGTVTASSVDKTSGFDSLDEAARTSIAKCRFKPATKDGKAVAAEVVIFYVWTLE